MRRPGRFTSRPPEGCTLNDRVPPSHALLRPRLPLGLVGLPSHRGAQVALRRPARLAQRHDRPDRERSGLRGARLHARPHGAGLPHLPRSRHAVRDPAAHEGPRHVADVPRRRRHPAPEPRARVRRLPRAAVRAVHDARLPRGRRRTCARRSPGSRASIPTRSSPPRTIPRPRRCSQQDRDEARSAAGSPTEFQGKSRQHRRPRPLHGAEHPVLQRHHHARGRRLPVASRPTTC